MIWLCIKKQTRNKHLPRKANKRKQLVRGFERVNFCLFAFFLPWINSFDGYLLLESIKYITANAKINSGDNPAIMYTVCEIGGGTINPLPPFFHQCCSFPALLLLQRVGGEGVGLFCAQHRWAHAREEVGGGAWLPSCPPNEMRNAPDSDGPQVLLSSSEEEVTL